MKEMFEQAVTGLCKMLGLPLPGPDWRRLRSERRALDRLMIEQQFGEGRSADAPLEYDDIETGRDAQLAVYQTIWLHEMARRLMTRRDIGAQDSSITITTNTPIGQVQDETRNLMKMLHGTLKTFANGFNEITADVPAFAQMRFSASDVQSVKEQVSGKKQYGLVTKGATSKLAATRNVTFFRARISTPNWSLSMRGINGRVEFFLVPATELFLLSQSETPTRLKSVLRLNERIGPGIWTLDGLPADPDELFYLCRTLFKTLVFASYQGMKEELDEGAMLQNLEGETLRAAVRELLLAEQNMAQKIVSQQEEIQNRIARDLHDAVIADIMALKRALSGDEAPGPPETSTSLDHICEKIREICHDLTPRDLRDWGLQTVIEDLLERVAQRTGADCSFECEKELPEFPYPVQLHLFRIVQECMNNIEKYAEATRVSVRIDVEDRFVRLTMRDNGKGYAPEEPDLRRAREGGTGLSGIRERADMIRCFYPTKLNVESSPGEGSATILEMKLLDL
ncbi:MAG TPA: sensor histidine kinase [Planktothrix sp.]|jgi:signal transduction histidine kinase